jgi:NAD(P)-dependent dehydrogenase (short-subunit alcohol dehydrogenase family)
METQQLARPAAANAPILTNKRAVIFGAAGDVAAAVATEFAARGASLYLSGRHVDAVRRLAGSIQAAGGAAGAEEVDAMDEAEVNAYLDRVAREAGSIDIVLNLIGPPPQDYSNGSNTLDLPLEHFRLPLMTLVPSQFVTSRAAARHMVRQHSGVILFITALPARGMPNVSAIGAAFGAMESLARCLAVDLGPAGVRVVGIRSGAMVDTRTIQRSIENWAGQLSVPKEQLFARFEQSSLLKRATTSADTASLAAFLASDAARTITGSIVNASNGTIID